MLTDRQVQIIMANIGFLDCLINNNQEYGSVEAHLKDASTHMKTALCDHNTRESLAKKMKSDIKDVFSESIDDKCETITK
jgi:hypothetical protein